MESDGKHTVGSGFIESFDSRYPTRILETLLQDRTTGRNIIWADNEYEALGEGYMGDDEITVEKITGLSSGVISLALPRNKNINPSEQSLVLRYLHLLGFVIR